MNCPECHKEIQPEWIYCHYCGTELKKLSTELRESNMDETYNRILAMYEFEQERRQALDSKSATYIGLTSVIVTVLLAVAQLLFDSLDNYAGQDDIFTVSFILYICAVTGFTFSAAFAFRAYHTGSVFMSRTVITRSLDFIFHRLLGTDVYEMVNPEIVLHFATLSPEEAKRRLLKIYSEVWKKNYYLNNLKSDRILICYALSSISLATIAVTAIIMLISKM